MVALGDGDLGGEPGDAQSGLHLGLDERGDRRGQRSEHGGGTGHVSAPEHPPHARPLQVHPEGEGRIEREPALDEGVGAVPLPQRVVRVDRVGGEDDARDALDTELAGPRQAALGELHGRPVPAEQVVHVGDVDPVAEPGHAIAVAEDARPLQLGEAALDVAVVHHAHARDVVGDRGVAVGARCGGLGRGIRRHRDGLLRASLDHQAPGECREDRGTKLTGASGRDERDRLLEERDRTGATRHCPGSTPCHGGHARTAAAGRGCRRPGRGR